MKDEVHRPGRRRGSSPRWRPAVLLGCCGLGAFAAPAAAQPAEPPPWWLAESPGASGARFGLGLDFRLDDLDSLLNAALTATVTLRDPEGGSSTQVIPGDPTLNNRKFDYEVEVRSWGAQAPIALPRMPLGGGMTLFPSLVVEAAWTEVTFDFRDRTEPELSTAIAGRGVSWGAGLEAAALGREGKWFLGGGYRFRTLPDLDLERSPPFDPILGVVHDEVRLDQDTHLASLRVGRVFAGGRVTPWLGVRGRWTELEIDDEASFVSPNGIETDLRTRSRFESDSVLAVAGVDAWLGGHVAGRAEVSYGDGDVATLLKVVYMSRPDARVPPRSPGDIADHFRRIRREFVTAADEIVPLQTSDPTAYVRRALDLLARTEEQAVEVLEEFDFIALADWIRARFDDARDALGSSPTATDGSARPPFEPRGRPLVLPAAVLHGPDRAPRGAGATGEVSWYRRVLRALGLVIVRDDEDCMAVTVQFEVEVEESGDNLSLIVYPASAPTRVKVKHLKKSQRLDDRRELRMAKTDEIKIGDYTYCIDEGADSSGDGPPCGDEAAGPPRFRFRCLSNRKPRPGPHADCPLDLATSPVTRVKCELPASGPSSGGSCALDLESLDRRCAADVG